MNELELTGRARTHVIETRCTALRAALRRRDGVPRACGTLRQPTGIDLVDASGFRDFDRQLVLWNRKWRGERPLYDRAGQLLDQRGSTTPHGWRRSCAGPQFPAAVVTTGVPDIDVIDAAAMPPGYQVELVPAEYAANGVFGAPYASGSPGTWVASAFSGPMSTAGCGAGIEPWHLSYAPVAREAVEELTLSVLRTAVEGSEMLGKEHVLDRLPEIYTRFILAVDPPVAPALRRRDSSRV